MASSAKDVETFPARPRHPPQANNGGTSPGRGQAPRGGRPLAGRSRGSALFGFFHKKVPNFPSLGGGGRGGVSPPEEAPPFLAVGGGLGGVGSPGVGGPPAVIGLRRVSWTGWERLYTLRSAFSGAQAPGFPSPTRRTAGGLGDPARFEVTIKARVLEKTRQIQRFRGGSP